MKSAALIRSLALTLLLVCASVLPAHHVLAAVSDLEVEPPTEPLSCLVSLRPDVKTPSYPPAQLPGTNAVVRVRLTFEKPDAAPRADLLFNNATPAFENSVREYVSHYRLPCLQPGKSFDGAQEFQFVVKSTLQDVLPSHLRDAGVDTFDSNECWARIREASPPQFPSAHGFGERVRPGVVLIRLTFVSDDQPPSVKVLYDGGQPKLSQAVQTNVDTYRIGCIKPGDPPVRATRVFRFVWEGVESARFLDELKLGQLVGTVKELEKQKVRFDFTTMKCPFKVRVTPYQPYMHNAVEQLGERDAGRFEFVEWLRNVTFDFSPKVERTAIGSSTIVTVPCALLDLS